MTSIQGRSTQKAPNEAAVDMSPSSLWYNHVDQDAPLTGQMPNSPTPSTPNGIRQSNDAKPTMHSRHDARNTGPGNEEQEASTGLSDKENRDSVRDDHSGTAGN